VVILEVISISESIHQQGELFGEIPKISLQFRGHFTTITSVLLFLFNIKA
jgi:hypothetical protein